MITGWQSDIFVHLWNWRTWMLGILLSALIDGNIYSDVEQCHFSAWLLSSTNGRSQWHQCAYHNSVSEWKKKYERTTVNWFYPYFSLLSYQYESTWHHHSGILGLVVTGFSILWCALSASKLFVTSLAMDRQQILVAYPAALFYGVFALITIFWDEKCLIQFVRWECKTTNKIEKLYLMWKFFFYAFHLSSSHFFFFVTYLWWLRK